MKNATKIKKRSEDIEHLENIRFTLSDNGKYFIVDGFEGTPTEYLCIPPIYSKKPITTIKRRAFYGICELRSLTISKNLTDFSGSCFESCSNLEKLEVNQDNNIYHSTDNCIIDTENKALILGCKTSKIPQDTRIIDYYAFRHCSGLKNIMIPKDVHTIRTGAFYGCSGLEHILCAKENSIYYSIENCLIERKCKILVLGCKNSSIPDDGRVKIIGNSSFAGCDELHNINIPPCITTINMDAFYNCTGLVSVNIPFSIVAICGGSFYGCKNLQSIIYNGTIEEWNRLKKGKCWDKGTPDYIVYCTDGNIKKKVKKD